MPNKKLIVNVPIATVWTKRDSARDIDESAISNPSKIDVWLNGLNYDTLLDLCEGNRVQTQVLYGQEVLLLEENEGWSHVIVLEQPSSKDERGYPGWIPSVQLIEQPEWNLASGPVAAVTSKKAILFSENMEAWLELSYETVLPVLEIEKERVLVKTPEGKGILQLHDVRISQSLELQAKGNGYDIVAAGEQFLGLAYLWGGMSSYGFDCSGFSYTMCKANGYIIPRDAHDQAKAGVAVALDSLEPGDLLFFAYEEGKGNVHHVGIYYGDGKLLHSPKTGKDIEITSIVGMDYEKELCAARRYWQKTED